MMSIFYKLFKLQIRAAVSGGIGAITTLVLLLTCSFIFAGAEGGEWFKLFFFSDTPYFVISTLIIAVIVFPFTRKLNIISHK